MVRGAQGCCHNGFTSSLQNPGSVEHARFYVACVTELGEDNESVDLIAWGKLSGGFN